MSQRTVHKQRSGCNPFERLRFIGALADLVREDPSLGEEQEPAKPEVDQRE